jgi:hypothetical protein
MATSMSADTPAGHDPLLAPFVAAEDEEAARSALGVVLETHALPSVRVVVRRELAWGANRGASEADVEDVVGTVIVRLTACLMRAARERKRDAGRGVDAGDGYAREGDADKGDRVAHDDAGGEPIGNVRAYAGQIAANACAEWLRARFPVRARLTAQIRYACRHHAALALWLWRERVWLCGLAAWRDARDPVDSDVLDALRGRLAAPVPSVAAEAKRIVTALFAVLREAGGPCRLGETVTLVADLLGIPERMNVGTGAGAGAGGSTSHASASDEATHAAASVAPSIDRQLEQRDFLSRVWREVRELPIRQRVALLLNLRDDGQQDALALVTHAGVATHDEVSACIGLSPIELTALLPDLPHDDGAIAERLGVTRRQVINLRKCARARLARRLGFLRGATRPGDAS